MSRRHVQLPATIGFGALLYELVTWGSPRPAFNQADASAVWPLAGLGIGTLARFGRRYWPVVFLGAFCRRTAPLSRTLCKIFSGSSSSEALGT